MKFKYWNYRVLKFNCNTDQEYYCICETFYDANNEVVAISDELKKVIGCSKNDLLLNITHMVEAFEKKVLNGDILNEKWKKNQGKKKNEN